MQKKNLPLIIALAIPVLMTLSIAISIHWPFQFVQPQSDFLYCMGDSVSSRQYEVQNNKLIKNEVKYPERFYDPQRKAVLFIYDVKTNKTREISFEEAQKLTIDKNAKSNDGFEVAHSYGGGYSVFPFIYSSGGDYGFYLKKDNYSKKIDLSCTEGIRSYYYHQGFNFMGWINKE